MENKKPKIIFWDIETSLGLFATFSLYPESISHKNIIEDTHIICACWKELGKKKIHTVKTYNKNDKALVKSLSEALSKADMLVAHNGDKFDIKRLNARLMYHNLPPLPPVVTLDTLKEIKKIATFTSHRLDFLGEVLCKDSKMETSSGLWLKALTGNRKAINEMARYCAQDVKLLESLYLRIRKYIKGHPNLGSKLRPCGVCGSKDTLMKWGTIMARSGIRYQKLRCKHCGSVSKEKMKLKTGDGSKYKPI